MFAAGLLVAVPIRTERRDRPPRLTDHHHERSTATVPAAYSLVDDNGQQCGWIVEDGRCFALDPFVAP